MSAGANGDANFACRVRHHKGDFEFTGCVIERDAHDAIGGTMLDNEPREDIFKAAAWPVRWSAGHRGQRGAAPDSWTWPVDECDDALADGRRLLAIVGDVQNRNSIGLVPGVKVFEDRAAQAESSPGERLVRGAGRGAGDECASEGDALLFAAGEFRGRRE